MDPMASRPDTSFKVRMDDQLKERVAEAAKASGRSMNAEIVHRLESSFQSMDAHFILGEVLRMVANLSADDLTRLVTGVRTIPAQELDEGLKLIARGERPPTRPAKKG